MKKEINDVKYLYLDKIFEEKDLELHIHLNEARSEPQEKPIAIGGLKISGSHLVTDATCEHYELVFENYVCYSVCNESFAAVHKEEEFEGNLFRIYNRSKFLDYVHASCITLKELAPGMKHYEIVCLNQIIDIATGNEPLIR